MVFTGATSRKFDSLKALLDFVKRCEGCEYAFLHTPSGWWLVRDDTPGAVTCRAVGGNW